MWLFLCDSSHNFYYQNQVIIYYNDINWLFTISKKKTETIIQIGKRI